MYMIINGSEYLIKIPKGRIRAISTSNTRNKIVTMKNRNENGARAFLQGSNPHSKGDNLFRFFEFIPATQASEASRAAIAIEIAKYSVIINISMSLTSRW